MKLFLKILLGCYLIFMSGFSFFRYYNLHLEGDLPAIVLPVPSYQTVMKDPFGLNVLLHDSMYAAPNRYFAHATIMGYFKSVPFWLQKIYTPIDSIYIAAALVMLFTQFFLIYLIARYATGTKKIWKLDFLIASAICVPLFQLYGYNTWMGIIHGAVTYTFFYSFSISLVMLFLLPFCNALLGRRDFNFSLPLKLFLILFTLVISFNGPLNVPVLLLTTIAMLLNYFFENFKKIKALPLSQRIFKSILSIPSSMLVLFSFAIVAGLYSFYIGRNNIENFWATIPMAERYGRLWTGFVYQYTFKLAQPMLIGMVILNSIIIYFLRPNAEAAKMMKALRWFAVLSVIYILLLPLGGYRIYRSNILRYDTIIPITLGLMVFYAYTSVYIFKRIGRYRLAIYSILIIGVSAAYINADWGIKNFNACERRGLEIIASSSEKVVEVPVNCSIISWDKIKTPGESNEKAEMLLYWNITSEKKLYFQK